jgi:hypothetical protein
MGSTTGSGSGGASLVIASGGCGRLALIRSPPSIATPTASMGAQANGTHLGHRV